MESIAQTIIIPCNISNVTMEFRRLYVRFVVVLLGWLYYVKRDSVVCGKRYTLVVIFNSLVVISLSNVQYKLSASYTNVAVQNCKNYLQD